MNPAGGVIFGSFGGRQLVGRSDGHVLVVGPTRCGKGMGVIVPTLLDGWYGSALIHDPKGELWRITAGRRSRYGHCLLFDPTNPDART